MILTIADLQLIFETILKKVSNKYCSLYIFVSYTTDSLCATHIFLVSYNNLVLKIFQDLLKKENILFKLFPVAGFSQLNQMIDSLQTVENVNNINNIQIVQLQQVRALVFINCGAQLDMTEKWFIKLDIRPKIRCFIFDSQKPVHHNNVHNLKHVVVVEFDHTISQQCPTIQEIQENELNQEIENHSQIDDEEEDVNEYLFSDEEMDEEKQLQQDKENVNPNDQANEQINENTQMHDEGQKEDQMQIETQRHKKQFQQNQQVKKIKQDLKSKIENYYKQTYHSISTSFIMYKMVDVLNYSENNFLWLAILGITDLYLQNKISEKQYDNSLKEIYIDVLKFNPDVANEYNQIQNEYTEEIPRYTKNKQVGTIFQENEQLLCFQNYIIIMLKSFRFLLLRHWNLYDSMRYSTYLVPRLQIWKENGIKKLKNFIQKLGIPLIEAKKQYIYMDQECKEGLKNSIVDIAPSFGLDEILFDSFARQITYKHQFSASDMVCCISVILQSSTEFQPSFERNAKSDFMSEQQQQQVIQEQYSQIDSIRNKNFWFAYDLLFGQTSIDSVMKGINLAIEYQKAIIKETIYLIDKQQISFHKQFRFCRIKSENVQENKFFQHPLALQKLALFIMDVYKVQKKEEPKPIVLGIQNIKTNITLVVAVVGSISYQIHNKNDFGYRFLQAATKENLALRQDDFQTSIIEILNQDYELFIEQLVFFS